MVSSRTHLVGISTFGSAFPTHLEVQLRVLRHSRGDIMLTVNHPWLPERRDCEIQAACLHAVPGAPGFGPRPIRFSPFSCSSAFWGRGQLERRSEIWRRHKLLRFLHKARTCV